MEVSELRLLARSVSLTEFVAENPRGFLVLHAGGDSLPPINAFATQAVPDMRSATLASEMAPMPLAKKKGNPFQDHISVGRARNCDIVIRHPTVSKLHARFRFDGEALMLTDAGSQNGTFLNGRRLQPNDATKVRYGAQLLFGSIPAKVLDAAALYDLLRLPG